MHFRLLISLIFLMPFIQCNEVIDIAYGAHGIISVAHAFNGNKILLSRHKQKEQCYTITFTDDQNALTSTPLIEDIFGSLHDCAYVCAGDSHGNVFVGGSTECARGMCCAIKKYKSNGMPDYSFGIHGLATFDAGGSYESVRALICCDDGTLLVGGNTNSSRLKQDALLVRLDRSGKLDRTFGKDGITITSFGGFDDTITALACDMQGRIYAGGRSDPSALMMLSFALSKQTDFDESHPFAHIDEKIIANFHGCSQEVRALCIDENRSVTIVSLTPFIDALPATIAAYNKSGILDTSFGNQGVYAPTITHINQIIDSFMKDPNPMLNAIGTEYEISDKYLALSRINEDGVLDETFATRGNWHATAPLTQGIIHTFDLFTMINHSTIHDTLSDLPSDPQVAWQRKITLKGWTEGDLCMALRKKYAG